MSFRRFWNWYLNHLTGIILVLTPAISIVIAIFNLNKPTAPNPEWPLQGFITFILNLVALFAIVSCIIKGIRFLSPDFGNISTVRRSIIDSIKDQCILLEDITGHPWKCLLQFPTNYFPRVLKTRYSSWERYINHDKQIKDAKYQEFELPPGLAWHSNSIQIAYLKEDGVSTRWLISSKIRQKVPGIINMISIPIAIMKKPRQLYTEDDKVYCVATFFNKSRNYNIVTEINASLHVDVEPESIDIYDLPNYIGECILTTLIQQELLPDWK